MTAGFFVASSEAGLATVRLSFSPVFFEHAA
jgi:hypothetical protein